MKKLLYRIQIILNDIANILKACLAIPLFSSLRSRINPRLGLEKLTIVGNGPSAQLLIDRCKNRQREQGEEIMVVNFFGSNNSLFEIRPEHYIIIDSGFYENKIDHVRAKYEQLITNLNKVDWPLYFYIPNHRKGSAFVDEIIDNKHIIVRYINTTPVEGPKWFRNYIYKNQLGMALCANIINAALFLGINLGFKKIDVYGIEHSWLQLLFHDELGNLCSRESHFYKDEHIIRLPKGSLGGALQQFVNCLNSYQLCEDYSHHMGCHIVNRTPGSFVDVFDIDIR